MAWCLSKGTQWHFVQLFFISAALIPLRPFTWSCYTGNDLVFFYATLFYGVLPHLFIQLKLGSRLQLGVYGVMAKRFPFAKGVGATILITAYFICIYLPPYASRYLMYAGISAMGPPYAWRQCNNTWTSTGCVFQNLTDTEYYRSLAEEDFYEKQFLQTSSGIDDVGGFPVWTFGNVPIAGLPLGLFITWFLVFLVIGFGGRICGLIMTVLGGVVVISLLVIIGFGYATYGGPAAESYQKFVYTFTVLGYSNNNWKFIVAAVIYQSEVLSGVLFTIGKATGRNIWVSNLSWIPIMLTLGILLHLPQLAKIPYLGAFVHLVGLDPGYLFRGNVFLVLTNAFAELEVPGFIGFLFYFSAFLVIVIWLALVMYTIVDNIVEAVITMSETPKSREFKIRLILTFVVSCVSFCLGLIHTTKAGGYFFYLMGVSVSRLHFLEFGCLTLVYVFVYVRQEDFHIAGRVIMAIWALVSALVIGIILLATLIENYEPLTYWSGTSIMSIVYPNSWQIISWLIPCAPFLAIPIGFLHSLFSAEGGIIQRCTYGFAGSAKDQDDTSNLVPAPYDELNQRETNTRL